MAQGGFEDSLEFLTECGICSEDFSLEGDHVPRILPCSHTFCEKCIGTILDSNPENANLLECPVCKDKHPVSKGARTFPQNQYIQPVLKKKIITYKVGNEEVCGNHGRVITLFCNNPECQMNICNVCMFEEHRNHNFVDLPQLQAIGHSLMLSNTESFKKMSKLLKEDLKSNKESFIEIKQELSENLEACESQIELQKDAKIAEVTQLISAIYDEISKGVKAEKEKKFENIDQDIKNIDDLCDRIESMEGRVDLKSIARERDNYRNFLTKVSTVQNIT